MGKHKPTWTYEKFNEEKQRVETVKENDYDGKITGHIVFNVKAWFDENPAERIRLGWTKHIHPSRKDVEYNKATQYLVTSQKQVDEYTIEDEYHVMDKSEDMLLLEELQRAVGEWGDSDFVWIGGPDDE